jgi:hypothetical protein
MRFPTLAYSERYDDDGRRLAFQFRPSVKQLNREALKRDTAERRAALTRALLVEKAEASGCSYARRVNPIERAAFVNRLHKPNTTDDDVEEIVGVVDAYLSGRVRASDWRIWLRRREEAVQTPTLSSSRLHYLRWTTSSDESGC